MHTGMDMPVSRAEANMGIEHGLVERGGRNEGLNQEGRQMAFVVEKIPESEKPKLTYVVEPHLMFADWAIDRERNAFIVLTNKEGGPYEGTQETKYYTLNWGGELIEIAADPLKDTFPKEGPVGHWRIHRLKLPSTLLERRSEVLQLVRDAFRAVGNCFNGYEYVAVNVDFDLPATK